MYPDDVKPLLLLILITISAVNARSQPAVVNERCPVLMRLPADGRSDAVIEDRLWFELRQCNNETVRITAYERRRRKPALTLDTGYTYPAFIGHTFNILVLESVGGSANHVLVVGFRKGRAAVLLNRSAGGRVQVERTETALKIVVPPKTYPDNQGTFPETQRIPYTFDLEY